MLKAPRWGGVLRGGVFPIALPRYYPQSYPQNTVFTLGVHVFRTFKRWVAGAEISALGEDVDKALDRIAAEAHRVEGLQLRLERLSNRVNMRMSRAGLRGDDVAARDDEIMREIAAARGNGDRDPFG